ncbi:MAG: hypothetical protein QM765_33705 [Myxococcales bacterium]
MTGSWSALRSLCLAASLLVAACQAAPGETGPQGPVGPTGATGATGDPGDPAVADPSISAIIPSVVFTGREARITISGDVTAWSDTASVDFGAGIGVKDVIVASPTSLIARVEVDDDAALGARDVVVTDGSATETYRGGFEVISPLAITTVGTLAQGSVIAVRARMLDLTTPFDMTKTGDGTFAPIAYPNIQVAAPAGTQVSLSAVGLYEVSFDLVVDSFTPAGDLDLSVTSGPSGATVTSLAPKAIPLAARQPVAATHAQPGEALLAGAGDSALFSYQLATAQLTLVDLSVTGTASTIGFFLPSSGKFADLFARGPGATAVLDTTDPVYVVARDTGGAPGNKVGLYVVETTVTGGAEVEPNDVATSGMLVTPPFAVRGATLSAQGDADWYKVTVTGADLGKTLDVQTVGLDLKTDTVVAIFDTDGSTKLTESEDRDFLDSAQSDPLQNAGVYYVRITASPYFDSAHKTYDLAVRLR